MRFLLVLRIIATQIFRSLTRIVTDVALSSSVLKMDTHFFTSHNPLFYLATNCLYSSYYHLIYISITSHIQHIN